MNEETYYCELKNHFAEHLKNSKLRPEVKPTRTVVKAAETTSPLPGNAAQYLKDQAIKVQQKIQDYENNVVKRRSMPQHRTSGGDADSVFFETPYLYQNSEYYARRCSGDSTYNIKQLPSGSKSGTNFLPSPNPTINLDEKYLDDCGDRLLYGTRSNSAVNCGICGVASNGSGKSPNSSKTVISRKSSHDLRHIVKSKCKLHEMIDETIKQMCSEDEAVGNNIRQIVNEPEPLPMAITHCCHCSEKVQSRCSHRDVMTEIAKGDFLDYRGSDILTISVDDVVNSKVINPMIRKLQRMYLNNLKEEMSLMEDLEKLPHKVNEVYKATILKQKD